MNSNGQFCVCRNLGGDLVKIKSISFEDKDLYRCTYCGTAQLFPYPVISNEDDSCYQDDSYLKQIREKEYYGYFHVLSEYIQSTLGLDKDVFILDFGSGYSYYQKFFLKDGFKNVHSLEINKHSVQFAKDKLHLKDVYDNLQDIRNNKYDLILANQVLEHLYDPIEMINGTFYNLLKDGGLVCLTVPNLDSYNRILLRKLWIGYSPDDHIWFFNKKSMGRIFHDSKNYNIVDMSVKSAVNTSYDRFVPSSFIKKVYYRTFMSFFEYINKGDQLIVTLKKN